MIDYFILGFVILNTLFWVGFIVGIGLLFKQMYPLFNSLTRGSMYATMGTPDQTEVP